MKLAEALQLRGDLQKRMMQLSDRLMQNARVQEGEKPAEDPEALLAEYESCAGQLEELMARINRTNCETRTGEGTLTELLARRDCLKMRVRTYHDFLMAASSLTQRGMRTEIKVFSTVPVPEYRKKADALSRQLRETDNAIQAANWTTELL
ncbi:MAG: DIP1984 family protein [Oscillospiraceae bacterium]|jgi:hypothetical protein|nr:DIP1984 family protein [Oscillospiraceae bacterium]